MKQWIYADHAATTKLDPDAFEAMKPFLLEEYGNPSQPYSFARKPRRALREARETIAQCIHADPEEIFFTSGGTESDNWAIKGMVLACPAGRAVVTSPIEHHAVLRACEAVAQRGHPVIRPPVTREGLLTNEALRAVMTPEVGLVSVMLANNEVGTIQPIQALCETAHRCGTWFHTDAVQAVGHIPVDVRGLGVDLLSASAHKFNGPKGVGFLYVRKGTPLVPCADGGSQEFGLRAGTENVAAIVGMAVALRNHCAAMAEHTRHLAALEADLMDRLTAADLDFRRNGGTPRLPGCLSLSFKNADGEALLHRLDLMGICISTGAACNSRSTQISHVLQAMGTEEDYARGTIRISLGADNTVEDTRAIAEAIRSILKQPLTPR